MLVRGSEAGSSRCGLTHPMSNRIFLVFISGVLVFGIVVGYELSKFPSIETHKRYQRGWPTVYAARRDCPIGTGCRESELEKNCSAVDSACGVVGSYRRSSWCLFWRICGTQCVRG